MKQDTIAIVVLRNNSELEFVSIDAEIYGLCAVHKTHEQTSKYRYTVTNIQSGKGFTYTHTVREARTIAKLLKHENPFNVYYDGIEYRVELDPEFKNKVFGRINE